MPRLSLQVHDVDRPHVRFPEPDAPASAKEAIKTESSATPRPGRIHFKRHRSGFLYGAVIYGKHFKT